MVPLTSEAPYNGSQSIGECSSVERGGRWLGLSALGIILGLVVAVVIVVLIVVIVNGQKGKDKP
jgi:disulfide bond formation protein DsbB